MHLIAPIVIFVRPQAAGNIGALARVMSNFGCAELRLVGTSPVYGLDPADPFTLMDWCMATKRGEELLKSVKWFPTLEEAIFDTQIVLGSSGRSVEFERGYGRPLASMDEGLASARKWQIKTAEAFKWAFVLGPEDDGLNEREAALCQKLMRISTVDKSPSINAAMAAGCVLYHWHLRNEESALTESSAGGRLAAIDAGAFLNAETAERRRFVEEGRGIWAIAEQKEEFLTYLMDTISHTKFLKYPDQDAVRARIRRWLQAAPMPVGELLFAFEIVYQLRSWGSGKFEERNFLKSKQNNVSL